MTRTEQRPGGEHRGAATDRARSNGDSTAPGLDDSDAWLDRDGKIHFGDGPYLHRPMRRLRRAVRRWVR